MESSNLLIDVGLQMREGRDSQPVIGVGRGHLGSVAIQRPLCCGSQTLFYALCPLH